MNNDVMKVIAEQIGALVITNANLVAKITQLEAQLAELQKALEAGNGNVGNLEAVG
jgi:hypothetical protein